MTTDTEDRSTWPRNRQIIRRADLLRLIEENRGSYGLDLRGAVLVGDGPSKGLWEDPLDLSPEALVPLAEAYREANGGSDPPWVASGGGINLQQAQLQRADLAYARLRGAGLLGAQLQGADLLDAELQGADLGYARLPGAFLFGAQLQGAVLRGAQLQGAVLRDAQLQAADLTDAQLQGVDMYSVERLDGVHWYGALLDHTRIKRESLGEAIGDESLAHKAKKPWAHHHAKEAYLLLKNNFNQIGRYEDASWAYVKEQQMERMAFYWEWHPHGWKAWRAWGPLRRWLRNWAYELLTGYGERPWNAVCAGVAAILAFAVGFWATGIGTGRGALAFLDCLVYSIATFATFNLARPDLNPEGRGIEIASSLEAILGISVLALIVFTLGNRMSRS